MDLYYPNSAWLCLRKDVFDRLSRYKSRQGLPTWETGAGTAARGRGGGAMNRATVDRIADAVLYEGYILYPYRPSVKNRQRWTFGGLYPEAYCRAQAGADAWSNQTECLIHGGADATVEAVVRFLHLTARVVGAFDSPLPDWPADGAPSYRPSSRCESANDCSRPGRRPRNAEVALCGLQLRDILGRPHRRTFTFPGRNGWSRCASRTAKIVGVLAREQQARRRGNRGTSPRTWATGLFRLTLRVLNRTPLDDAGRASRDDALLRSLVSTHAILGVRGGEFVSLLEPPEEWREAAAACRNVGVWPVLAGEEGQKT